MAEGDAVIDAPTRLRDHIEGQHTPRRRDIEFDPARGVRRQEKRGGAREVVRLVLRMQAQTAVGGADQPEELWQDQLVAGRLAAIIVATHVDERPIGGTEQQVGLIVNYLAVFEL